MRKLEEEIALLVLYEKLPVRGEDCHIGRGSPEVILSIWVHLIHTFIIDPILARPIGTYILSLANFEVHIFVILAKPTFLSTLIKIVGNS